MMLSPFLTLTKSDGSFEIPVQDNFSDKSQTPEIPPKNRLKDSWEDASTKPDLVLRNGCLHPRLPFCEAYDGINFRRTKTISESIQDLLQQKSLSAGCLVNDDERSTYTERQSVSEEVLDRKSRARVNDDKRSTYTERQSVSEEVLDRKSRARVNDDLKTYQAEKKREHLFVLSSTRNTTKVLEDRDPYLGICDDVNIKGYIDLKLDYDPQENCLHVTTIEGKIAKKYSTLPNTFLTVNLTENGEKRHRTKICNRSRAPVFNEMFVIEHVNKHWLHVMAVRVQLWRKKMFGSVLIGGSLIWLDDINLLAHGKMAIRLLLK